jgi:HSP20 family protein
MKGNKLLVTVELPGVKKENIKIHIEGMNLIIEAQSKTGNEDKQHGFFSFSSSYTGFRHIVRLPVPVDKKSSKANYNSGILKIILTKKNQSNQAGDIDIE